jgi:hypothetical protein
MSEDTFEGSLILEMLAEYGLVNEFYEAIDSDNIPGAMAFMRRVLIDEETIETAVSKVNESDDKQ